MSISTRVPSLRHAVTAVLAALWLLLPLPDSSAQVTPEDGDWAAPSVTRTGTTQAAVMVRTGDIDNLGFGWPSAFDPFTGATTPGHGYPYFSGPADPSGTDRIMVGSSFPMPGVWTDGYVQTTSRPGNSPVPITLAFSPPAFTVTGATLQIFVDDFQPAYANSSFQVKVNGRRAPFLESTINTLAQTGPVGKLLTVPVPPEFLGEIASGTVQILFDDVTTGIGDGFAVDFVKLLINPVAGGLPVGAVAGDVVHAVTGAPLSGVKVAFGNVSTLTADDGTFSLAGVTAGFPQIRAVKQGFTTSARQVDVLAGQTTAGVHFTLTLGSTVLTAQPAIELSFPTVPGGLYVIQSSTDFSTWTDDETLSGTGTVVKTFRSTDAVRRFWRVVER